MATNLQIDGKLIQKVVRLGGHKTKKAAVSKAQNNITTLLHDTSLLDVRAYLPETGEIEEKEGVRLFSPAIALITCFAQFFTQNPTDARAGLR